MMLLKAQTSSKLKQNIKLWHVTDDQTYFFLLTCFVSLTLQSLKNDLKDNMKMLNITYLISHYS